MKEISFSRRYIIPCLVQMLQAIFLWSVLTYIIINWVDKGFSHFQVGILIAVFPLTSLLLMIPFGIFVDRLSPKKLAIISYFIFSLAIAGLLLVNDFWQTFFMLAIGGAGNALFNNSLPSLYYKTLGVKYRGFKLGFFNAANLFGYGLGPLIAGYLYTAYNMNAVLIFSLSGFIPLFILSLFLAEVPGTAVKIQDYKADLSGKTAIVFLILVFIFGLHAGVEQSSLSLFLNKDIGLDKEGIGWLLFIHSNFMALLSIVTGIIGDRFNARGKNLASLFYLGIFISGITSAILFFMSSFSTVLAMRLTHAIGDSLFMVTRSLIISNLFISTRMGGNLGAITATTTMATLVGSVISGAVPGYASGFLIVGIISVIAIPIVMSAKPKF